jgi:hypothetical protein
VHIVQKHQFYGIPFTFINNLYNYYQPLNVLSAVSCGEILYCVYYGRISKFFHWLTTSKSEIINNFEIFHMMCVSCVTKVVSTFKTYITYIVTLIKLVKLMFGSKLVSSAAMHLEFFYIYILSELSPGCCMPLCSRLQLLFLYILCCELDIICCIVLWCWWCINFSVGWNLLEIIITLEV